MGLGRRPGPPGLAGAGLGSREMDLSLPLNFLFLLDLPPPGPGFLHLPGVSGLCPLSGVLLHRPQSLSSLRLEGWAVLLGCLRSVLVGV